MYFSKRLNNKICFTDFFYNAKFYFQITVKYIINFDKKNFVSQNYERFYSMR